MFGYTVVKKVSVGGEESVCVCSSQPVCVCVCV